VYKTFLSSALLGILCLLVALLQPPHLRFSCTFRGGITHEPLRAVFLLDGSGSIRNPQWSSELRATNNIIADFENALHVGTNSSIVVGIVQFGTDANIEEPLTNDVARVTQRLSKGIAQKKSGTNFANPLQLCQQELNRYTAAGNRTFDLCVLVTDGEDMSGKSNTELQALVAASTSIFGIFVGTEQKWADKLHAVSRCSPAAAAKGPCDFFASATNFSELETKAKEVAEGIAHKTDDIPLVCPSRPRTLWLSLLALLPGLAWFVWLLLPQAPSRIAVADLPEPVAPVSATGRASADSIRLRTAGRNETRDRPVVPRHSAVPEARAQPLLAGQ